MGTSPTEPEGGGRVSGRHGLIVRPITSLSIAHAIGGVGSKQRFVLSPGTLPAKSSNLTKALGRLITSGANSRWGEPAQRGVRQRGTSVQSPGHAPSRARGRPPILVIVFSRGRIQGQRVGARTGS